MNRGTTMTDWAEREVEIFLENLKKSIKEDDDFKYSESIYNDALKVYKLLMSQGHSGFSYSTVCYILKKLMTNIPLTAITGKDEEWTPTPCEVSESFKLFQNIRHYSLFKEVYTDGTVRYTDVDRYVCIDMETNGNFSFRKAEDILDGLFPITMPYEPKEEQFKIRTRRRYKDNDIGIHVLDILTPFGSVIYIDKYFDKISDEKQIKEISMKKFKKKYGVTKKLLTT